jgi:DNA-binding transcriptional ArsR family regulator
VPAGRRCSCRRAVGLTLTHGALDLPLNRARLLQGVGECGPELRRKIVTTADILKWRLDFVPGPGILKSVLDHVGVDSALRALVDPTRRALLERLSEGPASVTELAKPFNLSLAAITQHVQALERAGLVRTEKVGRVRTCRFEPSGLDPLVAWIAQRRAAVERQLNLLGTVLAEGNARRTDEQEG